MPDLTPSRFMRLWLAETLRLREAHWGALDDDQAVRQARQAAPDITERLHARAQVLGQAEHLPERLAQWRTGGWAALAGLALVAVLAGVGAAAGALGDGARPVNVVWALGALLGLHSLTFLLWLASLFWPAPRSGAAGGLGGAWLWLARKLARGPQAALIPSAFVNLLAQAGARRAFFGAISHLLWTLALAAALATLVALLTTAQYRFVWATTLLAPERFVALTHALGALPAHLGFPIPDAELVRASDGSIALPALAQAQWSLWLLGAVAVYGLLPRALALALCVWRARRALARLQLDPALPGYAALRERLLPAHETLGIDRPPDPLHEPHVAPGALAPVTGGRNVIAALELPPEAAWPPWRLPDAVVDAGRLDTREQRRAVLDALAARPAARVLLVCDARQTPDRGTIGLISELAQYTGQIRIWVAAPQRGARDDTRAALWSAYLHRAGLPGDAVLFNADASAGWLAQSP